MEYWPCPALLVQELRRTVSFARGGSEVAEEHQPPYEVRVVFADQEYGVLEPANLAGNYVRTLGPGEPDIEATQSV